MCQQGIQWKHICSILQSPNAFCDTLQCPRNNTNSTLMYHTHVSLLGTQLNIFLFTHTLPIHVSTWHAVEAHSLHLQSTYAFCDTWQSPRNYKHTSVVFPTHVSLVGTQLNIFLTTPTSPANVSTRHAVETHLLHSAVTQCILWHLTVSKKLHQLNIGEPHTCFTRGDSA